ncbi:hypothetical protein Fot_03895 [Forsythia ovata]|uniref:Uncharacterized protein n=1 Tax=Forsythia ovata TaxID=205694 RepID=A0ABD1XB09_9LAMI
MGGRQALSVWEVTVFHEAASRPSPPPLASLQRTSFRGVNEHPGPSAVLDNDIHYAYRARTESIRQTGYYGGNQEALEPSNVQLRQENTTTEDQKLKDISSRCDSQSSLSVSSPPNSPPHLSNDELDESGDSPMVEVMGLSDFVFSEKRRLIKNAR